MLLVDNPHTREVTDLYWSSMGHFMFSKDTLKAFDGFKQKSVWSNVFWYIKVFVFSKCVQYTLC